MNKLSKIILIAANIFPIFAVIFFNWSAYEVLFIYFSETFLFFNINLIKIFYLKIPISQKISNFVIYSFILGMFLWFAAGIIVLFYFRDMQLLNPSWTPRQIILSLFNKSYFAGLIIFLGSHLYSFRVNFLKKEEYLNHSSQTLIRAPGLRIWVLFMVTLGGILIEKYIGSVVVLVIFMLLKTGIDTISAKDRVKNESKHEIFE
ncbi:MAG: hypothetical protein JXR68_00940 [Bacteroidales bacterium]|nr:hypothetical protein [Bacteroidales bacterium]